jgi:hypothetical protein
MRPLSKIHPHAGSSKRATRAATRLLGARKSCWKGQLVFVFFQQPIGSGVGQVVKLDPQIASRRTSEVISPNLLELLRQVTTITVGIEYLRIDPVDLSSVWINMPPDFLAQGLQAFHCDLNSGHIVDPRLLVWLCPYCFAQWAFSFVVLSCVTSFHSPVVRMHLQ